MKQRDFMKAISIVVVILIILAVIFIFDGKIGVKKVTAKKQIEACFLSMQESTKEVDSLTAISSNPWDYVHDEYYDTIIDIGVEAVPVLTDMIEQEELSAPYDYVAGCAMVDITKCEKASDWSSVQGFKGMWKSTIHNMPNDINRILNSESLTFEEKEVKIDEYGLLAYPYLEDIISGEMEELPELTKEEKKKLKEKLKACSKEEIKILSEYVNGEFF